MSIIVGSANLCLYANFFDSVGNYANVMTKPQWSTSNSNVAKVNPSTDGFSAKINVPGTILGSATITVSAQGQDGTLLSATYSITVIL
jgi:hypothetical protein